MVSFLLFSSVMHILSDGQDAQIRPYIFQRLEAKRPENEMSGKINPSVGGLTYSICGHSPFHFPLQQVLLQKISLHVPLLNFGNSPWYIFQKLKKVELVKYDFNKMQTVTHYCY